MPVSRVNSRSSRSSRSIQLYMYARHARCSSASRHRVPPRDRQTPNPLEHTMASITQIPGYVGGTWDIDATHSTVGFAVRHMMVSKVRGYFREFTGEIVTAEDPAQSAVTATVDMDSIDTRQEQRDAHI